MRILVLNGRSSSTGSRLDSWIARYLAKIREEERGDEVEVIDLRSLDIRTCTGCWTCWWATPGRCAFRDGMAGLYPKVIAADLVVWAVPLVLGAQNALVKKTQDRLIPLLHPYIELVAGESHHRRRYAHYPDIALVVEPGPGDGEEDLVIVRGLFERFALNFRSRLSFFATTHDDTEEAADETRST